MQRPLRSGILDIEDEQHSPSKSQVPIAHDGLCLAPLNGFASGRNEKCSVGQTFAFGELAFYDSPVCMHGLSNCMKNRLPVSRFGLVYAVFGPASWNGVPREVWAVFCDTV